MKNATGDPRMIMLTMIEKAKVTVIALRGTSHPGRTWERKELKGNPSSPTSKMKVSVVDWNKASSLKSTLSLTSEGKELSGSSRHLINDAK